MLGAKVVTYANGFAEVQFQCVIAKPFSPPGEKLTKKILQLVNEGVDPAPGSLTHRRRGEHRGFGSEDWAFESNHRGVSCVGTQPTVVRPSPLCLAG